MATYGGFSNKPSCSIWTRYRSFLDGYAINKDNPEQRTFIFFPEAGSELVRAGAAFDPLLAQANTGTTRFGSISSSCCWAPGVKSPDERQSDSENRFIVSDGP